MGSLSIEDIKEGFEKNDIKIENRVLHQIFDGLNFHMAGKINYSEFLSAMVSAKNFPKEEKLISVFNLLIENEQNKNYITFESLMNAIKALSLNINEEEIKICFKEFDDEIDFEYFKKLILNEEDKKSYAGEINNALPKDINFKRATTKHKTH